MEAWDLLQQQSEPVLTIKVILELLCGNLKEFYFTSEPVHQGMAEIFQLNNLKFNGFSHGLNTF